MELHIMIVSMVCAVIFPSAQGQADFAAMLNALGFGGGNPRPPGQTQSSGSCPYQPHPNRFKFQQMVNNRLMTQDCAPGTMFDISKCSCVTSSSAASGRPMPGSNPRMEAALGGSSVGSNPLLVMLQQMTSGSSSPPNSPIVRGPPPASRTSRPPFVPPQPNRSISPSPRASNSEQGEGLSVNIADVGLKIASPNAAVRYNTELGKGPNPTADPTLLPDVIPQEFINLFKNVAFPSLSTEGSPGSLVASRPPPTRSTTAPLPSIFPKRNTSVAISPSFLEMVKAVQAKPPSTPSSSSSKTLSASNKVSSKGNVLVPDIMSMIEKSVKLPTRAPSTVQTRQPNNVNSSILKGSRPFLPDTLPPRRNPFNMPRKGLNQPPLPVPPKRNNFISQQSTGTKSRMSASNIIDATMSNSPKPTQNSMFNTASKGSKNQNGNNNGIFGGNNPMELLLMSQLLSGNSGKSGSSGSQNAEQPSNPFEALLGGSSNLMGSSNAFASLLGGSSSSSSGSGSSSSGNNEASQDPFAALMAQMTQPSRPPVRSSRPRPSSGGSPTPFEGLPIAFGSSGSSNPFGGTSNPFGGSSNPFGGSPSPFGSSSNPPSSGGAGSGGFDAIAALLGGSGGSSSPSSSGGSNDLNNMLRSIAGLKTPPTAPNLFGGSIPGSSGGSGGLAALMGAMSGGGVSGTNPAVPGPPPVDMTNFFNAQGRMGMGMSSVGNINMLQLQDLDRRGVIDISDLTPQGLLAANAHFSRLAG